MVQHNLNATAGTIGKIQIPKRLGLLCKWGWLQWKRWMLDHARAGDKVLEEHNFSRCSRSWPSTTLARTWVSSSEIQQFLGSWMNSSGQRTGCWTTLGPVWPASFSNKEDNPSTVSPLLTLRGNTVFVFFVF